MYKAYTITLCILHIPDGSTGLLASGKFTLKLFIHFFIIFSAIPIAVDLALRRIFHNFLLSGGSISQVNLPIIP